MKYAKGNTEPSFYILSIENDVTKPLLCEKEIEDYAALKKAGKNLQVYVRQLISNNGMSICGFRDVCCICQLLKICDFVVICFLNIHFCN